MFEVSMPPQTNPSPQEAKLREVAQELEATFLAEMLKTAGFGKARDAFGGGAGEDQYSSFLVNEHARALARTGGIGLAESLYQSLKEHPK